MDTSAPEEDPAAGFLADQDKELAELENDDFGFESSSQPVHQQQDDFDMFSGNDNQPSNTNYNAYDNFDEVPQSNGLMDNYAEISQQDQMRAEPEKIKIWRQEQKERLERKDREEEERKGEMRENAKKELDNWYKSHAEQLEKTKSNNQASEKAFIKERDVTQPGGEWEKICRLCEFNPKNSKNLKDVSRFRSILLQLKQTPLVR